jgi:hypothetical protein
MNKIRISYKKIRCAISHKWAVDKTVKVATPGAELNMKIVGEYYDN